MFSIVTYVMSRVTHSEPGLPMEESENALLNTHWLNTCNGACCRCFVAIVLRYSAYFLRGHNMLCLPKPLTNSYGINSFSYLAALSWNSLPDHHPAISDFSFFR